MNRLYFPLQLTASLQGTASAANVINPVTTAFVYDGNNILITSSNENGSKYFSYNPDGTLGSITGSGLYKSKVFFYSAGNLISSSVI